MTNSTAWFDHSVNSGLQLGQNNGHVEFHSHHGASEASRNEACLRDLRISNPRDDKTRIEELKGGILKDSYSWVLRNNEFLRWRDNGGPDRDANDRMLWIRADPGKGKTMLLCGIIDELKKDLPETCALSYFFCQQSDARLNDATSVLRGLIFLLVDQRPSLLSYIRPRYDVEGNTLFEDTNAWYALSKMFLEMLEDPELETTLLIIDALDECSTGLPLLLELVKRSTGNPRVKWIVSSRNWLDIEKHLTATYCSTLSLELNENSVAAAVKTYIRIKVDFLAALNGYDENTKDFTREYLTSNSNDTFLWVALVCERLASTSACEVENILTSFPASLDDLYKRMMRDIENSESTQLCRVILATVCTAYRPLVVEELSVLTDLPSRFSTDSRMITQIVKLCGSFLSIREDTIYFVHQSAKDFLLTSNLIIPAGLEMEHSRMLSQSIKGMNQTLRRNIYDIQNPGCRVEDICRPTPDPLAQARYCCTYWIDHLLEADPRNTIDLSTDGPIQLFLELKLLYWLEALSILGQFTGGIGAILILNSFLQKAKCADQLSSLVNDISRYMREFKVPIETSPLQAYSSALIWAPNRSLVKDLYQHERSTWITKVPVVEENWSRCIHTIVGNDCDITGIGWSQDGDRLLCMAADLTVRSWDPETGQYLSSIKLERHPNAPTSYHLSRHTGRVASVFRDDRTKIRICDAITGKCIRILDDKSLHSHSSAQWVEDGKHLVSYSEGGIQLWDVSESPEQGMQPVNLDDGLRVQCWSHDGCLYIATPRSFDDRDDFRHAIHDSRTGVCLRKLEYDWQPGHRLDSWSPDGSMLAWKSFTRVVIWDLVTVVSRHVLEGQTSSVVNISWSPDSTRIAISDLHDKIRIWDPKLGICLWTLDEHGTFGRKELCWAPDGNRLASYSHQVIRIWDTTPIRNFPAFAEHSVQVAARPHSRHRRALAYVRSQFTKLRRKALDQKIPRSPANRGLILWLYWSHGRARVASLTSDGVLEIWNTDTGYRVCEIEGYFPDLAMTVAWSSDGKLGTFDQGVLCVWNIVSGKRLLALSHNTGGVREEPGFFAWSPDGCQLASAKDGTVKIWDPVTGKCLRELRHSDLLQTLAWSCDGQKVASVSKRDGTVRLWDLATGQHLELRDPTGEDDLSFATEWHITWSHDNSRIAWGYNEYGFLYDTAKGLWIGSLHIQERVGSQKPPPGLRDTSLIFDIWDLITSRGRGSVDQSVSSIAIYGLVENGLDTSLGVFDVKGVGCVHDATESSPWIPVGYGISSDNSWITWNGDNLLWLPWQYRPLTRYRMCNSGANVAIVCRSGRAIFLSFAENPLS
ncbi:uncharacterized protein BO66DRAFT_472692 [Aspergillus aculeatinus CBS 121060]|uniref:Uncharacterized protein n=1 Tax=Aspergillus aculeatinus CBS 121060 TaxID=1448322 RepID=A0ACD1H3Y8_9EURO|nr:hypothetical protein BO66DRAFT_472692 [Aspergillus aculeatinus CBS 121060]RAH68492.1 hypothetical protein BO66DRAFT_472692 [Aspergillus aculeatinus CBS 121060]